MRNDEDRAIAKATVASWLARRDIGVSHQRAFLQGMVAALDWVDDVRSSNGARALQRLIDGEQIKVEDQAVMAGPPPFKPKVLIS